MSNLVPSVGSYPELKASRDFIKNKVRFDYTSTNSQNTTQVGV